MKVKDAFEAARPILYSIYRTKYKILEDERLELVFGLFFAKAVGPLKPFIFTF